MIRLEQVTKTFQTDAGEVAAIRGISLNVDKGDIFGIIGLSGAGKSTLVRCINYLERPSSGQVFFEGVNLGGITHRELLEKRRSISMIFQGFNLLAQRTVLRNVCYPLEIAKVPKHEARQRARELLRLVGLTEKESAYPKQLSGGQQQRVAIARALATNPKVLLCDEATSALDPDTTRSILDLLRQINQTLGVTIIIITHEMRVVDQICNKVAVIDQGTVVEEGCVKDVFMAPKSSVARNMILPKSDVAEIDGDGAILRIVFDGQSSFEPVISNLTLACRATVNILGSDTKNIGGKAFGQMIIQLPSQQETAQRMKRYLTERGIHFEEGGITHDHGLNSDV